MSTILNLDNNTYRHEFYDHQTVLSSSPTYSILSMESSSPSDGKYFTNSPSSVSNMSPQSTTSEASSSYNIQNLNITPNYEISFYNPQTQSQTPVYSYVLAANPAIPMLEITEQPVDKFRFRYQSEMHGTHGSLMGFRTEKSKKTFPTVELNGFNGKAIIRCSLYQVDPLRRSAHSHHLVIKNGDVDLNDPHDIDVSPEKGFKAVFQGMGIIHTAKKNIAEELYKKMKKEKALEENRDLTLREEHQLQKEASEQSKTMNLNQVCLQFQAFQVDSNTGNWLQICEPVYSNAINNMKSALTGELKICRLSTAVSSVDGGEEVFMFVEKVCKNNIKIRFYEQDEFENEIWHDWGVFSEVDVHHQYGIAFKTPPYKDKEVSENVEVFIQLYRPRDKCTSEGVPFKYKPRNSNNNSSSSRKRQRVSSTTSSFELPTVLANVPSCSNQNNHNMEDITLSKEFNKAGIIQEILDSQVPATISNDISFTSNDFKNFVQCDSEELHKLIFEIEQGQELSKLETDSVQVTEVKKEDENILNLYLNNKEKSEDMNALKKIFTIIKLFYRDFEKCRSLISALWMSGNKEGINCLNSAIEHNDEVIFEKLIDLLEEYKLQDLLDLANIRNETSLHIAIVNKRLEIVKKLLKSGANVNCCDYNGNSALQRAVIESSSNCVEEILKNCKKLKIDSSNDEGYSALHLAVRSKNLKITKILVQNQASVHLKGLKLGNNILHLAVENDALDLVQYILENVDENLSNEPNNSGYTPFQLACARNSSNPSTKLIVRELLKHNPELKETNIEEDSEENDEETEENVLSSMNLTCNRAEVINFLEEHTPADERQEQVRECVIKCAPKSLFDETCLKQLSKIFNNDKSWLKLASVLDFGAFVDVWEASEKPAEMLFNYFEMQQMQLDNLLSVFEALDNKDAIRAIDEMICRQMEG